ncbi:enoyl-CoA hydratase/isomerase family protein [Prescottella agglutinans]|uniref:Enoyl-CoA hydratase/carnithine racemase n=1 Tax=Prescottella agglutinans TaxID=1644129 RepID=A0ABT6MFJ8_9NOCA|nr:enoyl-CoA hydratase/isomerase family protein [Prescottella agglutinans]MDH6282665.1 enoyl-CoA hydratase/carnithine racemase [Prescottella agglutinans]
MSVQNPTAPTSGVVQCRIDGKIGTIVLNRPEAMNAITVELGAGLEAALYDLAPQVNVIVIRGAGGNFSVGGDFNELQRLRAQGREAMAPLFGNFARACAAIAALDVPVIAAVEGFAMAGGFELMCSADIVLVHENAKLADTHSNHGMVPGGGSTQRLPRLVGRQRALAHILTGDRLSAADAVAWGLAYRMLPSDGFDAEVDEFAWKLAEKDRAALTRSKRLIHSGLERPLADGIELEAQTVLDHLSEDSSGAGIDAFTRRKEA